MITTDNLREHKREHNKQNSWWFHDAKGIPLTRVCGKCVHLIDKQYRPEVLGTSGSYEDVVEETIEEEAY